MKKTYYFDWCPRAVAGLDAVSYCLNLPANWKEELLAHNAFLKFPLDPELYTIQRIHVAYRLDGLFAFCITWDQQCPSAWQVEINISSVVSHYLKTKLGHEHLYNRARASVVRRAELQQFIVHPIRLEEDQFVEPFTTEPALVYKPDDALLTLLSDPKQILGLRAMAVASHSRNAVVMLRARYARLFDRTFESIRRFRAYELYGVRIYRDLAFKTFLFFAICLSVALHKVSGNADRFYGILFAGLIDAIATFGVIKIAWALATNLWSAYQDRMRSAIAYVFGIEFQKDAYLVVLRHFNFRRIRSRLTICLFALGPFYLANSGMLDLIPNTRWIKLAFANSLLGPYSDIHGLVSILPAFANWRLLLESFFEVSLFSVSAFCLVIYTLEVSIKRRRALRSLRGLRGHLLFGSILSAVTENIWRASGNRDSSEGGFASAVQIVDDFIAVEKRKRLQAQLVLAPIFLVSLIYFFETNVKAILTIMRKIA